MEPNVNGSVAGNLCTVCKCTDLAQTWFVGFWFILVPPVVVLFSSVLICLITFPHLNFFPSLLWLPLTEHWFKNKTKQKNPPHD